jgi:hypothetical protein
MIIYKTQDDKLMIFIHIPKNSGKHMRKQLLLKKDVNIIEDIWGIKYAMRLNITNIAFMDHLSFINHKQYIATEDTCEFYAHSRNPYDRIISAFFYLNRTKTIEDFQRFCKEELINMTFTIDISVPNLHYYPQHLFVCDENLHIPTNMTIYKIEECENPKIYNLDEYFTGEIYSIINKVYELDFILFRYNMIEMDKIKNI